MSLKLMAMEDDEKKVRMKKKMEEDGNGRGTEMSRANGEINSDLSLKLASLIE